jgi:transcriptional regulator with XRE-family HTH domain
VSKNQELRDRRDKLGLSRIEVEKDTGLDACAIYRMEGGFSKLNYEMVEKLEAYYKKREKLRKKI